MLTYIARRLLLPIPTMLVVVTLIFFAVRGLGGDPALAILGDRAGKVYYDKTSEK